MNLKFWANGKVGVPADDIRKGLHYQYGYSWDHVSYLRAASKKGQYADRPVKFLRIFDLRRLPQGVKKVKKFEDLDIYQSALLFDMRIERDGTTYVSDRRPKAGSSASAAVDNKLAKTT